VSGELTLGAIGVSGTVFGIVAADGTESGPNPLVFVAATVHVYVFPFDSPTTPIGEEEPVPTPPTPPSDDVHDAEYPVIGDPPSNGVMNVTRIPPINGVTVGCGGASGLPLGIATSETGDGGPSPLEALVAKTVQAYELPFVRPPTMIGDVPPLCTPVAPPSNDVQVAV
jgi:hypothetical protein